MSKWVTSLILLLALTGSVALGVCGCLSDEHSVHSCCKPDTSAGDYISGKGCCPSDCESVASTVKTPQKQNSDNIHFKAPTGVPAAIATIRVEWLSNLVAAETPRPVERTGDNRLRFARGPDLYLRHNSFLI